MRIESILCHLTDNKAVVQVNGLLNEKSLGSALAEGPTVEVAEDKAILRLNKRINGGSNNETTQLPGPENIIKNPLKVELPKNEIVANRFRN